MRTCLLILLPKGHNELQRKLMISSRNNNNKFISIRNVHCKYYSSTTTPNPLAQNILFFSPQCLPWFFFHSSLISYIESSTNSKNWSYNSYHVPFSSSCHPTKFSLSRFSHALSQAQESAGWRKRAEYPFLGIRESSPFHLIHKDANESSLLWACEVGRGIFKGWFWI